MKKNDITSLSEIYTTKILREGVGSTIGNMVGSVASKVPIIGGSVATAAQNVGNAVDKVGNTVFGSEEEDEPADETTITIDKASAKVIYDALCAALDSEDNSEEEETASNLDKLQVALDVAGVEPTIGSFADGTNTIISLLRAASSKEPDKRKEHLINAGISAVSLIPFADVIKLLKLRKLGKPAVKLAVKGARGAQAAAKTHKAQRAESLW